MEPFLDNPIWKGGDVELKDSFFVLHNAPLVEGAVEALHLITCLGLRYGWVSAFAIGSVITS